MDMQAVCSCPRRVGRGVTIVTRKENGDMKPTSGKQWATEQVKRRVRRAVSDFFKGHRERPRGNRRRRGVYDNPRRRLLVGPRLPTGL